MIDNTQLITNVVSALIVAVLTVLFNWVKVKIKHSRSVATGTAIAATRTIWKVARLSIFDTAVICFILYTLKGTVASAEPLTRQAVLGISLWASILVSYVFALLLKR